MEHRWGNRRPLSVPVRLLGPGRLCAIGLLKDISLSGAYVQTLAALGAMSRITLEVARRQGDEPLQLRARVVRHGPGGVGVEWEEFASGTLSEIVAMASALHLCPEGAAAQTDARARARGRGRRVPGSSMGMQV